MDRSSPGAGVNCFEAADVRLRSMLSKKSQTASRLISRRKTNHAVIVRRYAPRPVTGEFIALRCLPPNIYKIAAPTARRICVQRCKRLFRQHRSIASPRHGKMRFSREEFDCRAAHNSGSGPTTQFSQKAVRQSSQIGSSYTSRCRRHRSSAVASWR